MRQENEIVENVLAVAKQDDCVRAVLRTNLLSKRAYRHSYEFYFVVNDIEKYEDDVFKSVFGERILLYRGDKNYPEMFPNAKAHLMVFCDGVTIVIDVGDKETFLAKYNRENVYDNVWIGDTFQKILDKDDMLPDVDRLDETQTLFSTTPSEAEYLGICSEFFWVLKSFSEYTLRKELLPAMFYLNNPVRDMLNQMLRWYIYLLHETPVDMGILDGNMEQLLGKELFQIYKRTYPAAEYVQIWSAYEAVVELWHKAAVSVAKRCGFAYPEETEKDMLSFIQSLKEGAFEA